MNKYFLSLPILILLILSSTIIKAEESAISERAETLFSEYKNAVVQVRIIDKVSQSKSAIGSGFFISSDGYIVSNFHVVSEWVYKPDRYQIKYLLNNKQEGELTLVGIDVVHDLALLKTDLKPETHFNFSGRKLIQGEHLYSFGNPHDIGLSIVEGTYNGYIEKSLYKKIHYTGSVNPGMSGGPVVDRNGSVAGVNVSGAGNQLSFLVPKEYVQDLVEKGRKNIDENTDFLNVIRDQVLANQQDYMKMFLKGSLNAITMEAYTLPGNLGEFMKCWGGTEKREKMLYEQTYQICRTEDDIYLSSGQRSGVIEYEHDLYKNKGLGKTRFFALMESNFSVPRSSTFADEEMVTAYECQSGQVEHQETKSKLVFCLREYKKFSGIYDAWMTSVVLASNDEVLQTSLMLSGVSYENAVKFSQAYMEKIKWSR